MATRVDLDGAVPSVGAAEDLFGLEGSSEHIWQLFEVAPDGQRFLVLRPTSGAKAGSSSLVVVSDWTAG